jgi:hypothetical protein
MGTIKVGSKVVALTNIAEQLPDGRELLHAHAGDVGRVVGLYDDASGPTVTWPSGTTTDCVVGEEVAFTRCSHAQVEAVTPEGATVRVDVGLSRALQALWCLGIKTEFSCQGHPERAAWGSGETGWGYVMFADMASGEALSALIDRRTRRDWSFELVEASGRDARGLRLLVRFPPADVKAIERAATAAVRRGRAA